MEAIGKINTYVCCDCKRNTLTINLATGVTPFGIKCPHCGSYECLSSFYKVPSGQLTVTHAWYRPSKEEFDKFDKSMKDHILQGGLELGLLKDVRSLSNDITSPDTEYEAFQEFCLQVYGEREE
jgi:hypothetical protein